MTKWMTSQYMPTDWLIVGELKSEWQLFVNAYANTPEST